MAKNRLDFKASLGRHSHDVSAGYTSQLTTGPIVPQYFDILGPGDSIYYKTHMFARFQPIVTAFLGEVDIHVDYFFVPLQMIYLPFGSIFANTNDYISSAFKDLGKVSVPLLNIMSTLGHTSTDVHGFFEGHQECLGKEAARLFDALDMNPFVVLSNSSIGGDTRPDASIPDDMCFMPNCCPWALYAYQAVYQHYYRNDEFETFNVQAYNIDQYYNVNSFNNLEAVKLRYVQRPSDYFTDIRVSPIFSAVNSIGQDWAVNTGLFPENGANPVGQRFGNNLFRVLNYLGAAGNGLTNKPQEFASDYADVDDNNAAQNSFDNVGVTQSAEHGLDGYAYLNAGNIRALFALDKYQRIFGRAKKTYDDQILAHFGIKIPHDVKHDITHLKHYRMVLQADTVVSNSAYEDLKLGQIGGQGSAVMDSDGEKFTAPVHGVFLAVAYAVTKPRYQETFSKLHLKANPIDFPQPEFDKLGAQPLYMYEFMPSALFRLPATPYRVGWQNRYQEFKQKYNRASISYMGTNTQYGSKINNVYAPWVLSQQPFFNYGFSGTQSYENHFINPTVLFESPHSLDNVMVTPYDGYWNNAWLASPHLMFQTDPIITEFMCKAKKVSWMSPTGEPDL